MAVESAIASTTRSVERTSIKSSAALSSVIDALLVSVPPTVARVY